MCVCLAIVVGMYTHSLGRAREIERERERGEWEGRESDSEREMSRKSCRGESAAQAEAFRNATKTLNPRKLNKRYSTGHSLKSAEERARESGRERDSERRD